jgi:hypothetical protein
VPPALAQRVIALTAAALLAVVVGLAITSRNDGSSGIPLPQRVGSWRQARAGAWGSDRNGTTTTCGVRLRSTSMGIGDPVLPCGAKLYIGYGNQDVLTQVIATGPEPRGVRFGLTQALARALGIQGPTNVRWSYAG